MENKNHPKTIRKMISYYYLVSFCPPEHIDELKEASKKMRTRLAEEAGCTLEELSEQIIPEAAKRIVAFHQATKEPEPARMGALAYFLKFSDSTPKGAVMLQAMMGKITTHPGRAKPGNRLHRDKGCAFCTSPCRYGFFSLISEPDFISLKSMLEAENKKVANERDVVHVLWTFTRNHIQSILETDGGIIRPVDLGNLSYCLLLLGTARSRFALPEAQLKRYQELIHANVQRFRGTPLRLS